MIARPMGLALLLAALATPASIAAPASPSPAPSATAEPPDLLVSASVSTAGPYGQSWYLHIMPDGEAALQIYYSTPHSGSVMGRFTIPDDVVSSVRDSLAKESFWDLPAEITRPQVLLHQPDLTLDVRLGARRHKVRLYEPDEFKNDPRARRFLRVWTVVYAGLPLKPTW